MDESESFRKVGGNSSMLPSPYCSTSSNSHDDTGCLRTVEQQQQQQQQALGDPDSKVSSSSTETSLFSWSTILANDSGDVWEPYALNHPPPTSDDQRRRSEALQAFLDLAMHQKITNRHEPRGEESADKDEEDISPIESPSSTKDQESQSAQQQQRESIADFLNVDYSKLPRIRDYQEQQWEKHYMDLCEFHQREGHCCVQNNSEEHAGLARWVKRQRYQYKLHQQGVTKSTMVPHRMKALERLGFVWDAHAALWEEQFYNLKVFRQLYGHCDVPSLFPANLQLSTWVKRQRRLYRENSMPQSRQEKLNEIGFEWKT